MEKKFENYANYFRITSESFCVLDSQLRFVEVNPAICLYLGRHPAFLYGKKFLSVVHPDDKRKLSTIKRTLKTGKPVKSCVLRVMGKNNQYSNLAFSATPNLEDEQILMMAREDLGLAKMLQDVNKSNAFLSSLANSIMYFVDGTSLRNPFEDLLEIFLSSTNSEYGFIGEVLNDEEGAPYLKTHAITNIAWNAETRKFYDEHHKNGLEFRNLNTLFGYVLRTGKEIIANDAANHKESAGIPIGHPLLKAFLGIPVYSNNQLIGMIGLANKPDRYRKSDRKQLDIFVSATSMLISSYRESRERSIAEKKLGQNTKLQNIVFENILEGVCVTSHSGDILAVNKAFISMLQNSSDAQIGRNIFTSIPWIKSDISKLLESEYPSSELSGEKVGRDALRSNLKVDLEYFINTPAASNGSIDLLLLIFRDISKWKQLQANLSAATMQAYAASDAKSLFLASLSHELRTPLHAVLGLTEISLAEFESGIVNSNLKQINKSAASLLRLVNDLLDFSKLEAGQLELVSAKFSIQDLVDGLFSEFGKLAFDKKLDLKFDISPKVPRKIEGDKERITQIVRNLIQNAIKYTNKGFVEVLLGGAWIDKSTFNFEIVVSDSGSGISSEFQIRLFQPFSQENPGQGAGIGLVVVKNLLDAMGGNISLKSELGVGTQFKVSIPLKISRVVKLVDTNKAPAIIVDAAPELKEINNSKRLPENILLVEDNHLNAHIAMKFLNNEGVKVTWRESGESALEEYSRQKHDLILMDIEMPGMGGCDAMLKIRENESLCNIARVPVIALTAHAVVGDREKYLSLGFTDYLSKPFSKNALIDVCRNVIDI